MPPLLIDTLRLTVWLVLLTLAFAPLERLFTLKARTKPRAMLADLGYFYLNGICPAMLLAMPLAAVSALVRFVTPAAYTQAVAALPLWLGIVLGLVVAEFGSYWAHRWCHRSRWLWQFHAIHHTPDHLDWLVNTRAHPVDILVTRLGGLVPLYLVGLDKAGGGGGLAPVLITIIGTFWSFFVHANVRWRFGWLEQLIATPAFHHWHHTNDEHRDRNFAATLPVIDRLLGTLHLPDHYPPVYGIDEPVAPTFQDEVLRPFLPPKREDEGAVLPAE
ncbi:sterol desaturase/sphingolipid hydroxylase (fatty acid hydroxylase superfamily) [Sphingomonas jinjuensis]|uniref:Sterol desaturase/sphingolipid hydroxylase (Fatty acid hydroxylase superfamily) n=1 Tax=Sphingomonas jinjuensis TaxID=535907 RepID=A0A840FBZ6_9SPHN|nr:sterol desaturase family protein [Sphingomonas jinjuensis]MBB4155169.1 sterol desaturase/sphingolipid hydroxylase (fatty acid hydroxylase superfamily) [Sphingomonas jinjuensis]